MKTSMLLATILSLIFTACGAFGAENGTVSGAPGEFALLSGYGTSHRGFGETRTVVQTFDIIPRYGQFLSSELAQGYWFQGRHEMLLELPYSLAVDHGGRSMIGASVFGSWKFTAARQVTPYLFAGGGVVFVDLGLPTMGSRWNGSYQAGGGFQHFIADKLAVLGEYRYHHISNLNTTHPNEPLNSSKFLIGLSYYR